MRTDPVLRWWSKVAVADGCWLWTGHCTGRGYGQFWDGYGPVGAHRYGYEALVGEIPDGMYVCHHCDNPPCVNPAHLFVGTASDNALDRERKGRRPRIRPIGAAAANAAKTHCAKGHPFAHPNLRVYNGHRVCAACMAQHQRDRVKRKRLRELAEWLFEEET